MQTFLASIFIFLIGTTTVNASGGVGRLSTSKTMNCSSYFANSATGYPEIYLTCPDGRSGFMDDGKSVSESLTKMTFVATDSHGASKEIELNSTQVSKVITSDMRYLSLGSDYRLNEEEIRSLGMDPNQTGNMHLQLKSVTLPESTTLYTDTLKQQIVAKGVKKDAASSCIYNGSAKVIKGSAQKSLCGKDIQAICVADVACKDPVLGWLTRSMTCKAEGESCPQSADKCFNEKDTLGIQAASEHHNRLANDRKGDGGSQ